MDLQKKEAGKYVFWAAVLLLVFLSYLILKPYFIALISGFILAYLTRPVYVKFRKKMKKPIAALLTIFLSFLVILLPLGVVVAGVTQQAYKFISEEGGLGVVLQQITLSPPLEGIEINLQILNKVSSFFLSYITDFVLSVPSFLIGVVVLLFAMYYFLVGWEKLTATLKSCVPFRNKETIGNDMAKITNVLVYGTLFMAFIEFVFAVLGFYLLGVSFFLLWAVLLFFLTFIPAIGPAIVWVPMVAYYAIIGDYFLAGGVLVLGLILSFLIDAVLRAKILGGRAKINPLVMILGILGGISVFGVFGFIIGPLILAYTLEILEEIGVTH